MSEIRVRKDDERWAAFIGDKRMVRSACRPCVVKALININRTSTKFDKIIVENEDGTQEVIPIGAASGR
jgi:hypothetical protein